MWMRWAAMCFSRRVISVTLATRCVVYLESLDEGTELMAPQIPVHKQQIAEFCRQHHIRQLSLFGFVLRADFNAQSYVEVVDIFGNDTMTIIELTV